MASKSKEIMLLWGQKLNPFLFLMPLNGSLEFFERQSASIGDGKYKRGTATGSGAVRYKAASGARWNYSFNPSAEVNTNGFTGNNAALTRSSDVAKFGSYAFKMVASGDGSAGNPVGAFGGQSTQRTPGNNGGDMVASSWVYHTAPSNRSIAMRLNGSTGTPVSVPPLTWTRIWHTSFYAPGNLVSAWLMRCEDALSGEVFYADGHMIEPGTTPTEYFDASTCGGVWVDDLTGILGTAHYSPSVTQAVAFVEEGTSNLFINPNANAGLTNATNTGVATVTRDTSVFFRSPASFKAVSSGTSTGEGFVFTSGGFASMSARTFIGQAKVKQSANGGLLMIRLDAVYSDASRTVGTTINYVGATTWEQQVSASVTTDPAKTLSSLQLFVTTRTNIQAITFYAADIQIEEKAYATSFAQGDFGTGYSWSGSSHASTSVRAVTYITIDEPGRMNAVKGGIAVRFRALVSGTTRYIMQFGDTGANKDAYILFLSASNSLWFRHLRGNVANATAQDGATSIVTSQVGFGSWDNGATYASLDNGVPAFSGQGSAAHNDSSGSSVMSIGGTSVGSVNINGEVGPVAIMDRPLTPRERSKLASLSTWNWRSLDAA